MGKVYPTIQANSLVQTEGSTIQLNHLPKKISTSHTKSPFPNPASTENHGIADEKTRLIEALQQTNGNQTKAAELLKINRVTVWNRMKKYGIDLKKVLSV